MMLDSRLSGILHVLLHMAERDAPVTSETLAAHMGANPVQIRRIMGGLRDAGFVQSERGHGGGSVISCDLASVTMLDIYRAIGSPRLFALGHRSESPQCLVEQSVNAALGDTLERAQQLVLDSFGAVTLAELANRFHASATARQT